MLDRRRFLGVSIGTALLSAGRQGPSHAATSVLQVSPDTLRPGEDLIGYVRRIRGEWDADLYRQILGAANEFKEGDQIVGVAAADDDTRRAARQLLQHTRLADIDQHPPFTDALYQMLCDRLPQKQHRLLQPLTLGELKEFLLQRSADEIYAIRNGLSSDVIACVVRLMTNAELVQIGAKIFNVLPGSQIGARGYLGARIQPNSPTDHPDDIRWQVFDGFAYAVGDVLLGTNPVSSDPQSVLSVEETLQELLVTFGIDDAMPHCVLAHIDVQAEVERQFPGSTELWFQSIAGSVAANHTFDVSLPRLLEHAAARRGRFGLYFETGQGADFTNGHAQGTDMVIHESRKYGLARMLKAVVQEALDNAGVSHTAWVHLNDVAGFIGPEVFRTREQLVRCCLEDIVMGKLHGLTLGLDVCSTLHMDVSLDDLDWCLDQILPACPAYLMALPTKIDPMLGYLTTGFQDHVRLREKFGLRVNDRMWQFFQELGVIDAAGQPTAHFGDPVWVYVQYCLRRGDTRAEPMLRQEGEQQLAEVRRRGVFIAEGFGRTCGELHPELRQQIQTLYEDSRRCIWRELEQDFIDQVPAVVRLRTRSVDRTDYILHPATGEQLSAESLEQLQSLRRAQDGRFNAQIVISDGLNAQAVMAPGHLHVLLHELRRELEGAGYRTAPQHLLVSGGRVRAGYRIGEHLFADLPGRQTVLHIIGERPGSGHHTLSVYITACDGTLWSSPQTVDHNITKVVSGIAATALPPVDGAREVVRILRHMD